MTKCNRKLIPQRYENSDREYFRERERERERERVGERERERVGEREREDERESPNFKTEYIYSTKVTISVNNIFVPAI